MPSVATFGVASVLSLGWILMIRDYIQSGPGWDGLMSGPPTDVALFLAATTAPLAAIWLAAVFLLVSLAMTRTHRAVRAIQRQALRTSGEIEALVRTSIEMQEQARRQSFLNGVELTLKDLNSQAGMLTGRLGVLSTEETEYLWALNAAGDPWAFCHALLERSEVDETFVDLLAERIAADDVASAGLQRFLRRYERLLALARDCDADKLVREVLEDGPLDRLYILFRAVSDYVQSMVAPPASVGDGPDGRPPDDGFAGYRPAPDQPGPDEDWRDPASRTARDAAGPPLSTPAWGAAYRRDAASFDDRPFGFPILGSTPGLARLVTVLRTHLVRGGRHGGRAVEASHRPRG
ncbi:hypothetical protein [uncultured Rhodospira sp.]|uniref:hypothetical protein n=1 Tax=uncultured Rhodospira sp. TaxID=1936189 RepID=UPI0026282935|nr:hypothetical protein [uncultured Rhodospira sp.]